MCLHVLYYTCLRVYNIYVHGRARAFLDYTRRAFLSNEEKKRNNGKSSENEFTCFRTHACYALRFGVIQSDVTSTRFPAQQTWPYICVYIYMVYYVRSSGVHVRKRPGIWSTRPRSSSDRRYCYILVVVKRVFPNLKTSIRLRILFHVVHVCPNITNYYSTKQ